MIRRYVALEDPRKVGLCLMAFLTVKLEKRGRMPTDAFARAVDDWRRGAAVEFGAAARQGTAGRRHAVAEAS